MHPPLSSGLINYKKDNVLVDGMHFADFIEFRVNKTLLFKLKYHLSSVINVTCHKGKAKPSKVKTVAKKKRFYLIFNNYTYLLYFSSLCHSEK